MKVLLFDATNAFIRAWAVVPTLNNNGESNGAVNGFLKSLAYVVNVTQPDRVILVWDGPGGSRKRRAINENYKAGRKPVRPNRVYDFELDNVVQNKVDQRLRLGEFLHELPVTEITIPDIEADDVIAYLVQYFSDGPVVIASSDKDFYQLIDDRVVVFNTLRKETIDTSKVLELYGVHPSNFCMFRSLIGDKSDNIKGIEGIGEKKSVKLFPQLAQQEKLSVSDLLKYSEENGEKYLKFLDQKAVIQNNYDLMQLSTPIIGVVSTQKIQQALKKPIRFGPTAIRVKLLEDGIDQLGSYFFQVFRLLSLKGTS